MPQIFQVLRCYICFVFQVHHTKKSNKFECKLCGEKQSIKRHYGLGTAKDCRGHVQKLNSLRGEINENVINENSDFEEENEINETSNSSLETDEINRESQKETPNLVDIKPSKWSQYVDKETVLKTEDTGYIDNKEVVLEIPKKRKTSKFKTNSKSNNEVKSDLNFEEKTNYQYPSYDKSNESISLGNSIINNRIKINNLDENKTFVTPIKEELNSKTLNLSQSYKDNIKIIDKNSKWAQYIDIEENNEDILQSNSQIGYTVSQNSLETSEGNVNTNIDSIHIENHHIEKNSHMDKENISMKANSNFESDPIQSKNSCQIFEDVTDCDWDSILDI